jgi:hypothetical protein
MSKMTEAISWFKQQFGAAIRSGIQNTPFSLDMLTAVALQETYYIWGKLHTAMPAGEVLKLCVGDTIDGRSAFPKSKAELIGEPKGADMFAIARAALESLGPHDETYRKIAERNPDKFCHGFGIFQYDIQHFKTDPDYFLGKRWEDFDACLKVCIGELKSALKRTYGQDKATLSDTEMVYVAIAYNRGKADLSKDFKQGFKDDSGKFYGEYISEYLQLSKSVP